MKHLFNKKSEKSPNPSQQHISLGTPTNITSGPLAYRAELDINAKGEQHRSYQKQIDLIRLRG
jgi:hypothetical protein